MTDDSRMRTIQELRNRMDQALAEGERGEGVDGETFMRELLDDLDAQEKAAPEADG